MEPSGTVTSERETQGAPRQQRVRQRRTKLQRRRTKRWLLGIRPKRRYRLVLFAVLAVLFGAVVLIGAGVAAATIGYSKITADLPSPEGVVKRDVFKTATIYDREGNLLYELWDPRAGRRTMMHLEELPATIISATLATEDANFYQNPGFEPRAIARAAWQNLRGQSIVSGASTITQQLVRNTVFDTTERYDQSYVRKLREVLLAYQLAQRYSKDQILEMYLNEVSYGSITYGIEAAAQSYFDKSAREVTLPEAALLAGLPQSPIDYNPLLHPERAKARQQEVLNLMVRNGFISDEEAEWAVQQPLQYAQPSYDIKAPHFSLYVREQLEKRYGQRQLYYSGLKVYTTLDTRMQEIAERVVKQHVATITQHNANDAALVAMAPQTGEVLAMVGSADYYNAKIQGQVNMATAERQPGSTLKPFTYLLAFQRGMNPASIVEDKETSFSGGEGQPPYRPHNHDGRFRGRVMLRQALACSLNIPAVLMLQYVGVPTLLDTLHKVGITSLNERDRYGLALTLGGGEVRLNDLTFAYATLANGGRQIGRPVPLNEQVAGQRRYEPAVILRIEDAEGNVLEDYQPPPGEEVLSPQLSYMITDILSDDKAREGTYGRHSALELSRPAAAKTGTTDDYRDSWTMGYTPELATGVWVGNADNKPMDNIFGVSGAGRIWHDFMEEALKGRPVTAFAPPGGLTRAAISALTGLRPAAGESVVSDWFLDSRVPQEWSPPLATPTASGPAMPEAAPEGAPTPSWGPVLVDGKGMVPALVGLSEADARRQVDGAGLSNTYTNYQGPGDVPEGVLNSVPPGHVLSQSPAPGTLLPAGAQVHIAVRKP